MVNDSSFSDPITMDDVQGMNIRERVLSCFVAGFHGTSIEDQSVQDTAKWVRQGLGGVLPFAHNITENPDQFKELMKFFAEQPTSRNLPVIRAFDGEGGRVWRFNDKGGFPIIKPKNPDLCPGLFEEGIGWKWTNHETEEIKYFPTPPAASIAQLSEDEAKDICERMADCLKENYINWNFAPVVDINPDDFLSPVIGGIERSYGDYNKVMTYANIMLNALKSRDIASCLKHYPGHGASEGDTHKSVKHGASEGGSSESVSQGSTSAVSDKPNFHFVGERWTKEHQDIFHALAPQADAVMTAHLTKNKTDALPATLSESVLTELREHAPNTVIISDDLFMGGIRKIPDPSNSDRYMSLGELVVRTFKAGCDVVILSDNPAAAKDSNFEHDPNFLEKVLDTVIDAINSNRFSEQQLNNSVLRILKLREELSGNFSS